MTRARVVAYVVAGAVLLFAVVKFVDAAVTLAAGTDLGSMVWSAVRSVVLELAAAALALLGAGCLVFGTARDHASAARWGWALVAICCVVAAVNWATVESV